MGVVTFVTLVVTFGQKRSGVMQINFLSTWDLGLLLATVDGKMNDLRFLLDEKGQMSHLAN